MSNLFNDLPLAEGIDPSWLQLLNTRLHALGTRYESYLVTKNYTFTDSDRIDSLHVDATAGNITITLPPPSGNRRRRIVKVDSTANLVIISPGAATINGGVALYNIYYVNRFFDFEAAGTGWIVIGYGNHYEDDQGGFFAGNYSLATTATSGFLYVPTCAGPPTGAAASGSWAPVVVDRTNNKLYFYSNGAWRDAGP